MSEPALPPGWVGGFERSNPAFPYPLTDLDSLPLADNLANIAKLRRQQQVWWPEFSWQTVEGDETSRCFQMFSPDISRMGYDDSGRVWALICPQQGTYWPRFGCLNVEVTVTGQRGWVDEPTRSFAVDLEVQPRIWFSRASRESEVGQLAWDALGDTGLPLPLDKARSIRLQTSRANTPEQRWFSARDGQSPRFASPGFAVHTTAAWAVGNLEIEIGRVVTTGSSPTDDFNNLVLALFNVSTGNMLGPTNLLTWNLWFDAPSLVDQTEWRSHAEKWRASIDAGDGSPTGPGTVPRYADGSDFEPDEALLEEACDDIVKFIRDHLTL